MLNALKEHRLNLRLNEEIFNFLNDEAGKAGVSLNALVCRYISDRMADTGAAAETDRHIIGLLESACETLTSQGADSRTVRDIKEVADILKRRRT